MKSPRAKSPFVSISVPVAEAVADVLVVVEGLELVVVLAVVAAAWADVEVVEVVALLMSNCTLPKPRVKLVAELLTLLQ